MIWAVLISLWIGAIIGFFVAALCAAAARGDEASELAQRHAELRN